LDLLILILINVFYAAVILIVALWLSGWVKRRIIGFAGRHPRIDITLFSFLGNVARYAILGLALIFVLNRFGVQTTSLVALLGAAGLAVGLALQGTLSNLAAGVMLITFRPFRVGDYITISKDSVSGTVREINLFTSELTTPDNIQIIVPNGDIWASAITNYSAHDTRRCDLVFGVAYDTDLRQAERIIRDAIAADPRARAEPEPFVAVTNLGESSVDFTLRVWAGSADFWDMKWALLRSIKEAFDANGVTIPFPTRTIVTEPAPPPREEAPREEAPREKPKPKAAKPRPKPA
jgi:small conductance mechanosensitive channel